MTTANSLVGYGYEMLLPSTVEEAGHLLRTNRRISVLVIDTDLGPAGAGLSLARDSRVSDPNLKVIYTSRDALQIAECREGQRGSVPAHALSSPPTRWCDQPTRSADCA